MATTKTATKKTTKPDEKVKATEPSGNGQNPEAVAEKKPLCLTGCGSPASVRGLCSTCRQVLANLVKEGKVKEEDLVKKGKLLPSKRGGGGKKAKAVEFFTS